MDQMVVELTARLAICKVCPRFNSAAFSCDANASPLINTLIGEPSACPEGRFPESSIKLCQQTVDAVEQFRRGDVAL